MTKTPRRHTPSPAPRAAGRRSADAVRQAHARVHGRGAGESAPASDAGRALRRSAAPTRSPEAAASHRGPAPLTAGDRVLGVLSLAAGAVASAGRAAGRVLARSRAARVALVAVVLAAAVLCWDGASTSGRVLAGVSVGGVDVSGKTAEEASAAIADAYGPRVEDGSAVVYASEEARDTLDIDLALLQEDALAEQRSVEDAERARQLWLADAASLGAALPADELAAEALAVGREQGGVGARVQAALGGWDVPVRLTFDGDAVEALAQSVDAALGEPRADWTVALDDGVASPVAGQAGRLVDRAWLDERLTAALLAPDPEGSAFVAEVTDAPSCTTEGQANAVADALNASLGRPLGFTYEERPYELSRDEVAAWLSVSVVPGEGGAALEVAVDPAAARATLLRRIQAAATGEPVRVSFAVEGDAVTVVPQGPVAVPRLDEALAVLDEQLLGPANEAGRPGSSGAPAQPDDPITAQVQAEQAPGSLTLTEAVDCGIVQEISSFTTQFTATDATANRTHNIQLICDILGNSVVAPGESWSFNERAGERTAERGFLGAGAIVGEEYVDDVGGGICQVATTVFNAVYESGLPIDQRSNHSLYIASYPAGRDAAVSWPDLDLVWRNDTSSDVLAAFAYTGDSITVTLYGVDPGYSVTTQEGEWTPGKKHSTRTERDDTLAPGTSYVKTEGADGQGFSVFRTVTAQNGEVVREDAFYSTYAPITEVVVKGPDAPEEPAEQGAS